MFCWIRKRILEKEKSSEDKAMRNYAEGVTGQTSYVSDGRMLGKTLGKRSFVEMLSHLKSTE